LLVLCTVARFRKVGGFIIPRSHNNQLVQSNTPNPYYYRRQSSTGTEQLIPRSNDAVLHSSDLSAKMSNDEIDENMAKTAIEDELERLQQTFSSIEALEERNKAQIESFVDEEDQWNSLEEFERQLLSSKTQVVEQMEKIAEELLQMWMGAKSMEG
jgi:hypothetical protein